MAIRLQGVQVGWLGLPSRLVRFLISIAQDSLKMYAEDSRDDPNLQIAIYSLLAEAAEKPFGAPSQGLLYPAKVRRLAQAVADAFGIDVSKVSQNGYHAVDKAGGGSSGAEQIRSTAAGHMIFDYDPDGPKRGQSGYRLMWQRSMILGDQWKKGSP